MRDRRYLGFVAAAATLLAAAPLSTVFDRWTWLLQCLIAVALISGAAALARWWRSPLWVQALGMLGALLIGLTWMFPSGNELLGTLPTPDTFAHFGTLASASVEDIRSYGIPVPDTITPLLFITVLGVGAVAIIVDLLTVGLSRPALAGLPMLAIYSVPVAIYVDSVPAAPFVVGAIGFLWLLMADNVNRVRRFGRRFTGDGRDVDGWEPSPLAATGRRLGVIGIVLAVLLPLAVPGMTSGLMNRYDAGGGDGTGRGGQGGQPGRVNLFAALSGELNRSQVRNLLTVTTDDRSPHYLRFAVADELRRSGFAVRGPSGTPVPRAFQTGEEDRAPDGLTRSGHQASVTISNDFNMPFLPVYPEPVGMRGVDASWLYDPNMQIVFSNKALSKGKKYSFDYLRPDFTPALLRTAAPLPPDSPMHRLYTAVPEPVREVEELVNRLTRDQQTDYDRVRAIYDYFSRKNGFRYSLSTQSGTSGQDIVNFLTNKVGFCQQYATAMAWLVRAAHVPARVAFGFTGGTGRQDNNTYTLTNLNLHAWTEVYFNDIGWVPFDATPASNVPGSARSVWAPDTDAPAPVPSATAPNAEATTDPSTGPVGERPDRDVDETRQAGDGSFGGNGSNWPWWAVTGALLLLALLALPTLGRNRLRRRRYARVTAATATAPIDDGAASGTARVVRSGAELARARAEAHAAWDELLDTMIDYRVPVDPTETPRATADRLVTQRLVSGPAADAARLLGQAEERARYAREPLREERLVEALGSVRQEISAGTDRRTRLIAATLPPSLLLRWRLAVMDASGRIVATTGRLRDGLLRWTPRRLLANARSTTR